MLIFINSNYLTATLISFVVVLILAFGYHEFAHAIVADHFGDPTPRRNGRITLNPFKHLNKTGFIMAVIIGFGWASTPVNPNYFRGNPRLASAVVSVAGPLANLFLAVIFAIPLQFEWVELALPYQVNNTFLYLPSAYSFLTFAVYFNVLLFAFNLLPIPPLDGFNILLNILPIEIAIQLQPLYRYSMLILLGVVFLLPAVGINIIWEAVGPVLDFLFTNLTGLPGVGFAII